MLLFCCSMIRRQPGSTRTNTLFPSTTRFRSFIAKAFGLPIVVHPEARAILEANYEPGQLTEARLRMARTPQGAVLIDNPVSKAPGFQVENVFVMAGIPAIMQAMRSEERRVGKECGSTCRSRWAPYN